MTSWLVAAGLPYPYGRRGILNFSDVTKLPSLLGEDLVSNKLYVIWTCCRSTGPFHGSNGPGATAVYIFVVESFRSLSLIGVVAGVRAMTAPAAVSWAALSRPAHSRRKLAGLPGLRFTPWILALLAVGELVADQLPSTPSRKVPIQFATRVIMGGLSGAAIGASGGSLVAGLAAGAVGAVLGTLGGATRTGRVWPPGCSVGTAPPLCWRTPWQFLVRHSS